MLSLTSILKKTLMALTGLAWFGFLVGHLTGNFLLFKGPQAFNDYAHMLESTGALLWIAEIGLVAFLATHIYSGIKVSLENRNARPNDYEVKTDRGQASIFSRSMLVGGVVMAIFIVTHVLAFKFGTRHPEDGLFGLVRDSFQNPLTVAWYVLAMVAVGMHLSHGLASALQTLGVSRSAWRDRLRTAGLVLGWLIAGGFISIPIGMFMNG